MNWAETIASWFGVFSDLWSGAKVGPMASHFLWPLNALACAAIAIEAFVMLYLSHNRLRRLSYGFVSFGAFAYLAGELGGEYMVVAPVETLFHWAIVAGLGAVLRSKARVPTPEWLRR